MTRPADKALGLSRAIAAAGATAVRLATIAIGPPADLEAITQGLRRLGRAQWAVFVSTHAVAELGRYWPAGRAWPQQCRTAAVGSATAAAVAAAGFPPALCSQQGQDSEALLALPELRAVAGLRVVVVRGEGGRELLAETLRERGAEVEYLETYRRLVPEVDGRELRRLGAGGWLDVVTSTSNQTLDNLLVIAGDQSRDWLTRTPLVVVGRRQERHARELGFRGPVAIAPGPDDQSLCTTLMSLLSSLIQSREQ